LAVLCFDVTELEEAKKASEAAAAATAAAQQLLQQNQQLGTSQSTPDYAVGLTAMNPPTPAPATPSYSPATPQHPVTTIIAIPRDAAGEGHSVDSRTVCQILMYGKFSLPYLLERKTRFFLINLVLKYMKSEIWV